MKDHKLIVTKILTIYYIFSITIQLHYDKDWGKKAYFKLNFNMSNSLTTSSG
jgi:hypothetical protein